MMVLTDRGARHKPKDQEISQEFPSQLFTLQQSLFIYKKRNGATDRPVCRFRLRHKHSQSIRCRRQKHVSAGENEQHPRKLTIALEHHAVRLSALKKRVRYGLNGVLRKLPADMRRDLGYLRGIDNAPFHKAVDKLICARGGARVKGRVGAHIGGE